MLLSLVLLRKGGGDRVGGGKDTEEGAALGAVSRQQLEVGPFAHLRQRYEIIPGGLVWPVVCDWVGVPWVCVPVPAVSGRDSSEEGASSASVAVETVSSSLGLCGIVGASSTGLWPFVRTSAASNLGDWI